MPAGKNLLFEGAQGTMLDHRSRHLSVRDFVQRLGGRRLHRNRRAAHEDRRRDRNLEGLHNARGRRPVPHRSARRRGDLIRNRGHEFGSVTGRPRRCGWFDVPAAALFRRAQWLRQHGHNEARRARRARRDPRLRRLQDRRHNHLRHARHTIASSRRPSRSSSACPAGRRPPKGISEWTDLPGRRPAVSVFLERHAAWKSAASQPDRNAIRHSAGLRIPLCCVHGVKLSLIPADHRVLVKDRTFIDPAMELYPPDPGLWAKPSAAVLFSAAYAQIRSSDSGRLPLRSMNTIGARRVAGPIPMTDAEGDDRKSTDVSDVFRWTERLTNA